VFNSFDNPCSSTNRVLANYQAACGPLRPSLRSRMGRKCIFQLSWTCFQFPSSALSPASSFRSTSQSYQLALFSQIPSFSAPISRGWQFAPRTPVLPSTYSFCLTTCGTSFLSFIRDASASLGLRWIFDHNWPFCRIEWLLGVGLRPHKSAYTQRRARPWIGHRRFEDLDWPCGRTESVTWLRHLVWSVPWSKKASLPRDLACTLSSLRSFR